MLRTSIPSETNGSAWSAESIARSIVWSSDAAARFGTDQIDQSGSKPWRSWRKYLARRPAPKPLRRLTQAKEPPLEWGTGEADNLPADEQASRRVVFELHRLVRKPETTTEPWGELCSQWLACAGETHGSTWSQLEPLAWAYALPQLSNALAAEDWWAALSRLLHMAEEHTVGRPSATAGLLLGGELRLALACLLPEMHTCRTLADSGRTVVLESLEQLVSEEGVADGSDWSALPVWLACWTRSWLLGRTVQRDFWPRSTDGRLRGALSHVLQLCRRDGSLPLGTESAAPGMRAMLAEALDVLGNRPLRRLAAAAVPKLADGSRATGSRLLPEPAFESETAHVGLLRTGWNRSAARLVVNYASHPTGQEFDVAGRLLLTGETRVRIARDGQELQPVTPWQQVCWSSDDDMDYLELEAELSDGSTLQRQFTLCRSDRIAVIADAVLGAQSGDWTYEAAWPLADGTQFELQAENTEGVLTSGKSRLLVLPLALPEWRVAARGASLDVAEGSLRLRMAATGRALFAPLWIDCSGRRHAKPFTWRHLTVAEERQIAPRDVAVGYRVQSDRQQWLIYRSLAEAGCRTLLGHNLISDYLVARFHRDGTVETLVEIEA